MKKFNVPKEIHAIIFDIDSTLYTNPSYAFEQVDCQIREFAKTTKITCDEARKKILEFRKKWSLENEGKKISLGNTLVNFGIPIEKSIEWRKKLLEPKNFLTKDEKLIETLKYLSKKYKMICVTNNPVLPARKTLDAIGISEFFPEIVGLDTCYKSKPAYEPFEKALEILSEKAEFCVSVGDRFDLDIALPLEMGFGGILVNGVEDVYSLVQYF